MGSRFGWFLGKIVSVAAMLASAFLLCSLYITKMFPDTYLIIAAAVLAVANLLVAVLTWNSKGKVRFVIGLILGIALTAVTAVGSNYMFKTVDTAKAVTSSSSAEKGEVTEVGVYVNADNDDDFDAKASGYRYGVLTDIDRETTDKALEQFKGDYGTYDSLAEYNSLPLLVTALKDGDVDAVFMNTAFLSVLEEMDDFEKVEEDIKLVKTYEVEKPEEKEKEKTGMNADYDGNAFAVYLSGIDTRSSQLQSNSRSDVNIIAVVNPDSHQILLVSTPRDYFVPLSISNGARDKLTHAGIYGIQCSMDTIGMLYNLDVEYYFRVNFTGFQNIIDALGGVTVHSDYDFTSDDKFTYKEGDNDVNGAQALSFVRERHAFAAGDNQRGRNQMHMIKAILSKMMSVDMLKNYSGVLSAIEGSFETTLPYDMLSDFVKNQLESGSGWNVVSYSATGSGSSAVPYSMSQNAYVMLPDENSLETAKAMIKQVYDGDVITQPEISTETETDGALAFESETNEKETEAETEQ